MVEMTSNRGKLQYWRCMSPPFIRPVLKSRLQTGDPLKKIGSNRFSFAVFIPVACFPMHKTIPFLFLLASLSHIPSGAQAEAPVKTATQSLDGDWRAARDPKDRGRAEKWFDAISFPEAAALPAKVPGAIGEVWMGTRVWSQPPRDLYWYIKSFVPRMQPEPNMRYYLRFGAVKHSSDVWLNGNYYDPITPKGTPRDMRWLGLDFRGSSLFSVGNRLGIS